MDERREGRRNEGRPKMSRREYERRKAERLRKLKIKRAIVLGGLALAVILVLILLIAGVKKIRANKAAATKAQVEKQAKEAAAKKAKEKVEITVSATGDILLGTDADMDESTNFTSYYDKNGASYFLANVKSVLDKDDLTVANLDAPLTDSTEAAEGKYIFKGAPNYTEILTSGGVDAVSLTSSHSKDYGDQGLKDTQDNLKTAKIASFGYDDVTVKEVKGVKIGLVGIQEVGSTQEECETQLKANIKKAQDDGAVIIIVNFYWGTEKETTPNTTQVKLGHAAIDAGATLVIGQQPHVIQGIEKYNGRYIAYSLGNFCYGGNSNPDDKDCYIFQQTFTVQNGEAAQDEAYKVIPCSVSSTTDTNDYKPTPLADSELERVQTKIDAASKKITDGATSSDSTSESDSSDSTDSTSSDSTSSDSTSDSSSTGTSTKKSTSTSTSSSGSSSEE